jgi:hypothetical protein
MSEKKDEAPKVTKNIEIPKEEYWSFIKVARESVKFVDGTLYPMLERRGVGKETIATLSVLFASALQEVMITQMSIMRTGIEPTISLSQVEKAVNEIYKQYSSGAITPKEAIDSIFNVLSSLSKKTKNENK